MKCGELLNKHFCNNKIQLSPMRQQKLPISTFPIISLWKRCHSNESSWTLTINSITFAEGNVISLYAKFQLHPPYGFWEEEFLIFYRKFTPYVAILTNQIKRFGQKPYET